MKSKTTNTAPRRFRAQLFIVFVAVVLTMATTSLSSSMPQGGKMSVHDIAVIMTITSDDIRKLPSGENRLILEGGDTSAPAGASGGVWKTINGGKTWDLMKTGTRTKSGAGASPPS